MDTIQHRTLLALAFTLALAACRTRESRPALLPPGYDGPTGEWRAQSQQSETVVERPRDDRVAPAPGTAQQAWDLKPKPWTDEFTTRSMLLADRITISGPAGLLEHLASSADIEHHDRNVRTVPEGHLQEVTIKTDNAPGIRAQLDGMQIMALEGLTILTRTEPADVVIRAVGEAVWRDPATGEVRRADTLQFTGELEK